MPGVGASSPIGSPVLPPAELTLETVFDAYFDCRRHKRNSLNQLKFEIDLEKNLVALWRDLREGRYEIGRSIAFIVTFPKIREVWAADFRDRVVHHLIYNALRDRFHKRFIRDSYACIPGRGNHDGLRRVSGFARSITRNGTRPAYVLKADIANFFNSIDQACLLTLLEKQVPEEWLCVLIRKVLFHDPRPDGILRSSQKLFSSVPRHKSFLQAEKGKGLPIGNLTSQFFANVYLNELDQFVKHKLRAKYYGRYVDDIILFHEEGAVLNQWYKEVEEFLEGHLNLQLHPNKKWLNRVNVGVDFTGFIIKPGRTYLRQTSLKRGKQKIRAWERAGAPIDPESLTKLSASLNSYLGILRQVNGYKARKRICERVESLFLKADENCTKLETV